MNFDINNIKSVAVVGSGTMGLGIANVFALSGYKTLLFDINKDALEKAKKSIEKNINGALERNKITKEQSQKALGLISYSDNFEDIKADFIIEAILEDLNIKVDLFNRLSKNNSESCIFATNTSTIPITQIGAQIPNPERLVGMHFFNPAHIMKLVEVISGVATNTKVAEITYALAEKLGKKPVHAKDAPGFIVNRVARHFYVEGLKILEENVANYQVIDDLMRSSGFKMGPFQLMDLIGVDTNFAVTSSMYKSFHFDEKFRPNRIQELKVLAGHNGRKSGKGFYDYSAK